MRDPIQILIDSSEGRVEHLVPFRYDRMSQSPFAFFRGAAAVMAHDLLQQPTSGQLVQACGDAHLANFGVFATPERKLVFDVNDFDETLQAPWEWDIKRLAASFVIAGRDLAFKRKQCQKAARAAAHSYRRHMGKFAKISPLGVWYSQLSVSDLIAKYKYVSSAEARRIDKELSHAFDPHDDKLVDGNRFRDNPPLIYHPTTKEGREIIGHLNDAFLSYLYSLPDERRILVDHYEVADVAVKVVGVGSVGTRCGVLLLTHDGGEPLILQVKEARPSVLAQSPIDLEGHQGERVVTGQRMMQAASDIFLGWSKVGDYHFYIRQLRDVKIKPQIEKYSPAMMAVYAEACGWALARAHARTGEPKVISHLLDAEFDNAMVESAETYADVNNDDYRAFLLAIDSGRLVRKAA